MIFVRIYSKKLENLQKKHYDNYVMEENNAITFDDIRNLLTEEHYQEEDIAELEQAFEFAKKLHAGQYRISEEPYIIHPIEVVKILIGLRADKHTLMAGFLHDVLEDTDTTPDEIKERFGEDVLNLVQGVTKLGKLQFKSTEERQAEILRQAEIARKKQEEIWRRQEEERKLQWHRMSELYF